ncbi:hypothetical protein ACFL45_09285, partial [Candidatus Neomarinimicrobiota bacterium]
MITHNPIRIASMALLRLCLAGCLLPMVLPARLLSADTSGESVEAGSIPSYEYLFEQLVNLASGSMVCAPVNDLTLNRDVASFSLSNGYMYLLKPINSRSIAAVFEGEGSFIFSPPTDVERDQLYRFFGVRTMEESFNYLVLLFSDSTARELEKQLEFTPCASSLTIRKHYSRCLDYVADDRLRSFDSRIVRILLNNLPHHFFRAHVGVKGDDPLFFGIDPFSVEEISLSQRATPDFMLDTTPEVICSFHQRADYDEGMDLSDERKEDPITLLHYNINATIAGNLKFSASAEIKFE